MKLLKVQIAFVYSMSALLIVGGIGIAKDLLVKVLEDFKIFDFSNVIIKLNSFDMSMLWHVTILINVVLFIIFIVLWLNADERETAKATTHIRKFCRKDIIQNAEDKTDIDYNREVKRYNKVISRMKVIVENGTATFIVKFNNLADKNAFLANEDLILQEVKSSLPEYTFGTFEQNKMVGKKIDK